MDYKTNAQIAEWYGPPCRQPIVRVRVAGSETPLNKKARRLFRWQERVFKMFPKLYKDLTEKHADDWGYNCRPVTGHSGPTTIGNASKHAWGLADDTDADENVRGTSAKGSEIWRKGGDGKCVRLLGATGFTWGGWFPTPDPHHFEVAVSPQWIRKRSTRRGTPRSWYRKILREKGFDV